MPANETQPCDVFADVRFKGRVWCCHGHMRMCAPAQRVAFNLSVGICSAVPLFWFLFAFYWLFAIRSCRCRWVSTTIMKVIVVLVVMVIEVRGGDGRSDGDGVAILLGIALGMVMVWQLR